METEIQEGMSRIKVSRNRPSYKNEARMWRFAAVITMTSFAFMVGWAIWLLKANTDLRRDLLAVRGVQVDVR